MRAYYYEFRPTGVAEIDRILEAVARAGKGAHHTQDWNEFGYIESIQGQADAAAESLRQLRALVKTIAQGRDTRLSVEWK